MDKSQLMAESKRLNAPYDQVIKVSERGKLPVVNFAVGGIATPADAALMMQLGAEGIFVGSGIFKSENPERRAKAIVDATSHHKNAEVLAEVSKGLGKAMKGLEISSIEENDRLAVRGL